MFGEFDDFSILLFLLQFCDLAASVYNHNQFLSFIRFRAWQELTLKIMSESHESGSEDLILEMNRIERSIIHAEKIGKSTPGLLKNHRRPVSSQTVSFKSL